MDDVECEKCPIIDYCPAHKEEKRKDEFSYHPQSVVRVSAYNCPLIKDLVKEGLCQL